MEATESQEEREERLELDRNRAQSRRANETQEQREARLATDAQSHRDLRADETPEQREARLATDAQSHRDLRANLTPEQTEVRLATFLRIYLFYTSCIFATGETLVYNICILFLIFGHIFINN